MVNKNINSKLLAVQQGPPTNGDGAPGEVAFGSMVESNQKQIKVNSLGSGGIYAAGCSGNVKSSSACKLIPNNNNHKYFILITLFNCNGRRTTTIYYDLCTLSILHKDNSIRTTLI